MIEWDEMAKCISEQTNQKGACITEFTSLLVSKETQDENKIFDFLQCMKFNETAGNKFFVFFLILNIFKICNNYFSQRSTHLKKTFLSKKNSIL